jgi:phage baseplate assembly protein W
MTRHDYAFPFRIDGSGQAGQAGYEAHVEQMVKQVLLTSPGERIDLPEFGCGLRRLVFAPHDENLNATTQMIVRQSLTKWLGTVIDVQRVRVLEPGELGPAELAANTDPEAVLALVVEYVVRDTLSSRELRLEVH